MHREIEELVFRREHHARVPVAMVYGVARERNSSAGIIVPKPW